MSAGRRPRVIRNRLDKPAVTLTFHSGSSRLDLAVGAKSGDTAYYARDLSKPSVVTIDKSLAEDLRKGVDDYRSKDLFDFRAFNAQRIEFVRGGAGVVFEKTKGQGDNAPDKWKRVSPNAGDVDKDKFEAFLAALADIRATSFAESAAKTGLDTPALVVNVKFDDGKRDEQVKLSKSGSDAYAARADDPGAKKIDASKLDDALKSLDNFAK